MEQDEWDSWRTVTASSTHKWMEEEIFRLNGRGAMYYTGGEEGSYMEITRDGMLKLGIYEGALPHIGEAIFTVKMQEKFLDFNDALQVACHIGGTKFLADLFSANQIPQDMTGNDSRHIEVLAKFLTAEYGYQKQRDTRINEITVDDIRQMSDKEGLVLQGCGGDTQEWIDGINMFMADQGILLDGDTFKEVSRFEHNGRINLIFHMDGVKLDVGKLAMWRLQTHQNFGGTWLSDYLPNRLGVNSGQQKVTKKPDCPLIGADGNIFNLTGIASRTLTEYGMAEKAKEMWLRVRASGSYSAALTALMDYVTPVGASEHHQNQEEDTGMTMGNM